MRITIALIGGALLVACASLSKLPAVEKTKSATLSSSNVLPQPSPSQASQADEESALEKIPLRKAFLEKLKQVPNSEDREQYIGAIYELNRLSKKDLKNKAILETLVQNQEKLLPILQTCGFKHWNGLSSFQSIALYQSKFWKLSNGKHLIQLVCGTGAYNLSFAFFIASELSEKTQFKPLTLTEFYEDKNGRVQRKEAAGVGGGTCPDSQFNRKKYYIESTKELCIWSKYIGMGICGTRGIYKLQNDKLVLQKFTANFDCQSYDNKGNYHRYETLYP